MNVQFKANPADQLITVFVEDQKTNLKFFPANYDAGYSSANIFKDLHRSRCLNLISHLSDPKKSFDVESFYNFDESSYVNFKFQKFLVSDLSNYLKSDNFTDFFASFYSSPNKFNDLSFSQEIFHYRTPNLVTDDFVKKTTRIVEKSFSAPFNIRLLKCLSCPDFKTVLSSLHLVFVPFGYYIFTDK